jgi:hypothetical protein
MKRGGDIEKKVLIKIPLWADSIHQDRSDMIF